MHVLGRSRLEANAEANLTNAATIYPFCIFSPLLIVLLEQMLGVGSAKEAIAEELPGQTEVELLSDVLDLND